MNNQFPLSSGMLVLQNYDEFNTHFFIPILKKKSLREMILHLCHFQISLFWVSISLYGFPYHSVF